MINSGMIFAWLIYNMDFREQPWTYTAWESEILVIKGSWFIGSIVGGFNCGYFIDSIGRRRVIVRPSSLIIIHLFSICRPCI